MNHRSPVVHLILTFTIFINLSAFTMPSITIRLPETILKLPETILKLPNTIFRLPDTTPRMPDTTPVMPDTTPRMPGFIQNIISGIRKFIAPPSPSNIPQYLMQYQELPATPTPTPITRKPENGTLQIGTYKFQTQEPTTDSNQSSFPSFSINAPSGWYRMPTSGSELTRFESPEIDTQETDEGTFTTNAIINVRVTDAYPNLDEFFYQYKSSNSKARLVSSNKTKVNDQDAYFLEFTYAITQNAQELLVHEVNLLFFKNGYSFLVKGISADYAWNKNAGTLRTSLYSFKLN